MAICARNAADHRLPCRRVARYVARPITKERTETHRVRHHDQRRADERRPVQRVGGGVGVRSEDARVSGVEGAAEGDDAEQEQHRGGDDGDLVDQQHEPEAVDADHQHQQREDAVGHADRHIVVRQADGAVRPPTRTSPDVHTEIEKNATAVNSDRNDPMTRPCTPRCADDETALLVPLRGPNNAIGARIAAPRITPSRVASSASRKDRPKMIGKLPSTTVAMVLAPPKTSRNRSSGPGGAFGVRDRFDAVRLDFGDLGRGGERWVRPWPWRSCRSEVWCASR